MSCKIHIVILLLLAGEINSFAQEYNRHISKSFLIGNTVSVEISNKYGKVHFIPWDNDSVKFNIDMRIRSKDNQKIEKIKKTVDFEFTTSQYFIIARTKFGEGENDVIKDLMDIAGSYFSSSNSVTINYTVMVPANATLKIDNKFGDVFFDDHNGPLNLILSYGDLKANRLNGKTEIKLTSGDAEITYLRDGIITLSYSNAHIREVNRLTTQTQSSNITIDKSSILKLKSRRDKFFLNDAGSITGETYFSAVNIGSLRNDLNLSSKYGDIIVDEVYRSFSSINITSELTDMTLSFVKPLIFNFELLHHQAVTFAYPSGLAKISTKIQNAEEKILTTSGSFGTGFPESRVNIKALRKCNLTISAR